jgi:response regulator RpfG family c-di-GMP phosphodiesterase
MKIVDPIELPCVVLIDDEKSILRALTRELDNESVHIEAFNDPLHALQAMDTLQPDLVISDVRMPGMDGIDLLDKIAQRHPHCERILITGYSDTDTCMKALNNGGIHYFLSKPWDRNRLLQIVRKGLEFSRMRTANKQFQEQLAQQNIQLKEWNQVLDQQVLERTKELQHAYFSIIKTFSRLIDQRMSIHKQKASSVVKLALELADELKIAEEYQTRIKHAALLRNLGKISFPSDLIETPFYALTKEQLTRFRQHPLLASLNLQSIIPMTPVAQILRAHCENIDGSGYPAGLSGSEINTETQILHIACDYFDAIDGLLLQKSLPQGEALNWIQSQRNKRYCEEVVNALVNVLNKIRNRISHEDPGEEKEVPVHALAAGMMLSRNLVDGKGLLLLPQDSILDTNHIDHLLQINNNTQPPLSVFVKV